MKHLGSFQVRHDILDVGMKDFIGPWLLVNDKTCLEFLHTHCRTNLLMNLTDEAVTSHRNWTNILISVSNYVEIKNEINIQKIHWKRKVHNHLIKSRFSYVCWANWMIKFNVDNLLINFPATYASSWIIYYSLPILVTLKTETR